MERIFLSEEKKLAPAVAEYLLKKEANTGVGGVKSLDHILAVVPTRQAGRRLRLSLAELAGGRCIPPRIVSPAHFLQPEFPSKPIASPLELTAQLAVLLMESDLAKWPSLFPQAPQRPSADWALDVAEQLLAVWKILLDGTPGRGGLSMEDVARHVEEHPDGDLAFTDSERWNDLASLEKTFFASLTNRLSPLQAQHEAQARPPVPAGVEKIVLAGLPDPVPAALRVIGNSRVPVSVLVHAAEKDAEKFDEWGRPLASAEWNAPFAEEQIRLLQTVDDEAEEVAKYLQSIPDDEELPAVVLLDAEIWPKLQSAVEEHCSGLVLENPNRTPLRASSLGRLAGQIIPLREHDDYALFANFLKSADVQTWLCEKFSLDSNAYADILKSLDKTQGDSIAQTALSVREHLSESGKTLECSVVDTALSFLKESNGAIASLRNLLQEIFAHRKIFSNEAERSRDMEFAAAAKALNEIFDAFESPLLPEALHLKLFARELSAATFSLEPEGENIVRTNGWLEATWADEEELLIVGFNEGNIPEAVTGHAFIPDKLREELGLASNRSRTARDAFLLRELVLPRKTNSLRIHLHGVASDKTVAKPSRLLFPDDSTFVERVQRLYKMPENKAGFFSTAAGNAWRINLPFPEKMPPLEKLSPTALERYLKCPFNYFLRETFGEPQQVNLAEMKNLTFGTLAHEVLEAFAKSPLAESREPEEIAAFLRDKLAESAAKQFGKERPVSLEMQLAALGQRLKWFASAQAKWRSGGWKILRSESDCRVTFDGVLFKGKIDRVDVNEETGKLAIVDYKTWDEPKTSHSGNRWEMLQLPIYRMMLSAARKNKIAGIKDATALYCILGETRQGTLFDEANAVAPEQQADAEKEIRRLLANIRKGIFWPPSKKNEWKSDYGELFPDVPQNCIDRDWIEDQQRRIAEEKI